MESGFLQKSHSSFVASLLSMVGLGPLVPFLVVGTGQVQATRGDDGTQTTESRVVRWYLDDGFFVQPKLNRQIVPGSFVLGDATSPRSCLDMDEFQFKRFVGVVFFPGIQFLSQAGLMPPVDA